MTPGLEAFMHEHGEILHPLLLEPVWSHDDEPRSNLVDVYVRYPREKVDRPFGANSIETVHRHGHRLRRPPG